MALWYMCDECNKIKHQDSYKYLKRGKKCKDCMDEIKNVNKNKKTN